MISLKFTPEDPMEIDMRRDMKIKIVRSRMYIENLTILDLTISRVITIKPLLLK
ncbi:MAG: hypothetical protein QXS45_05880 [Sulfolobales archaeon]